MQTPVAERFRRFAHEISKVMGTVWAFFVALAVVVVWLVTGPFFHFSETWQLVINTLTTILTFLMVFLLQTTQNRDSKALHLKLDELIRTSKARNLFADLEDATEEEIRMFEKEFHELRSKGVEPKDAASRASRKLREK